MAIALKIPTKSTTDSFSLQDFKDDYNSLSNALPNKMITEIDSTNALIVGTKKADTLCWDGQCTYAVTPTTVTTVSLANVLITNLRFGQYTLIARLKSANNTLATNSITIDIQKNNSSVFSSLISKTLKATDFTNTTDYKLFYINFEYKQTKATNNELKIVITLLQQVSAYEVDLDSIVIMPSVIGLTL